MSMNRRLDSRVSHPPGAQPTIEMLNGIKALRAALDASFNLDDGNQNDQLALEMAHHLAEHGFDIVKARS